MSIVVSDDESTSGHVVSRPRRNVTLSSRLTDANNDATPELSAHRNKPPVPAISAQKPVPTGSKRGAKDVVLDESTSDEEGATSMENGPHTSKFFCTSHLRTTQFERCRQTAAPHCKR